MIERRPPQWNFVSVCTPFIGVLGGVVGSAAGEGIELALLIWALFCVFGLVAAGIALFRTERLWGLTATGLGLNVPIPLLVFSWWIAISLQLVP